MSSTGEPLGSIPEWHQRALCPEVDPELFFPEKGGSTYHAKKICGRCEVIAECLQWALDNRIDYGILGGKSVRERRKLLADAGIAVDGDLDDDEADEEAAA